MARLSDEVAQRLRSFTLAEDVRTPGQAAVLLALTDSVRPEVILTRRAQHLRTHRGEIALPGGKRDADDESLWQTALRESFEEVALPSEQVAYLGCLPPLASREGLSVTPFVGRIPEGLGLTPNLDELDCIFQVPLDYFADPERLSIRWVERDGEGYACPRFFYDEHEIWGLTAVIVWRLARLFAEPGDDQCWPSLFSLRE